MISQGYFALRKSNESVYAREAFQVYLMMMSALSLDDDCLMCMFYIIFLSPDLKKYEKYFITHICCSFLFSYFIL